jgi:hypothetical protein
MPVGPGFVFPFLHKIEEAVLLDLFVGDGAFQLDFAVSHLDDFPVSSPRAALNKDFVAHLGGVGTENHNPVAGLFAFSHGVLLLKPKIRILGRHQAV